jgi:hypothetical protein
MGYLRNPICHIKLFDQEDENTKRHTFDALVHLGLLYAIIPRT